MREWTILLGGLVIWAAHFFTLYAISSILPGEDEARFLVLGATEAGRRRALAGADLPIDWAWPPTRLRAI